MLEEMCNISGHTHKREARGACVRQRARLLAAAACVRWSVE
jgi:hypothetical protein